MKINDGSRGTYNTNSQIRFKDSVLKLILCDCSVAYIFVKWTITVANTEVAPAAANNNDTEVIFKKSSPFTDCISVISNTQIDYAKDIDVVMTMYNLVYSDRI